MKTIYEYRKGVTRELEGSTHTLPILFEYAWSMLRVCLEYAYSMPRVCLEYAYTHLIWEPAISVRARRTASPLLTDQESAAYGLFLTLLLLISGVVGSWGQTDYSGTYYIGVYGNGKTSQCASANPADNFYLCPTEGWCYYNGETNNIGQITNGDNGQPFLTSFKCRNGVYDATKAVWTIEKAPAPNSSYYYIKQTCTGKYLVFNKQLNGAGGNRVRVHLKTITPPATPDEYALFEISTVSTNDDRNGYCVFHPKKADNGYYMNITNGNVNSVSTPGNVKTDGPSGYSDAYRNVDGIVGQWNQTNNTSSYKLEPYSPFITFNASNKVEIKAAPSNATLVYTTDESDPTASPLHGTAVNTNTVSFAPDDDVTTIKAIAIVNGVASAVATFTPPALLGSDHKRLIQSQNNAWNTTDFHFYMIPGDDVGEDPNKITKVNTTSLFRPTMEWHLLYAGKDDLAGDYLNQYYYIVNSNDKYLCYDETNKVYMDTNSDNSDKFKFQIVESATAGTYNIIPFGVTTGNMYLNKQGSNAGADALILFNKPNEANSRWKFVKKNALVETAPFTATENNSITYYKLQNYTTSYYVIPPSWTGGAVTASNNSTDADIVKSRNWYFEVAQPSSDTDWLTWYYIRNAVTGDYLYYSGSETSNDDAAFITKASLNPTDENDMKRYRFTWARSATENYYFIVPQLLKDESQNTISGLNRNSTTLRIFKSKSVDGQLWQFVAPDYTVAPPNIVYNADVNTVNLSCTTPGATIYYTTNNTEATTSATDSGSSPITIDLKADDKENITIIRAIAEASSTSSNEVTNNIIVQATVGNVKRPYLIRNNQSSWTVGSEPMFVYYMIPSDVDNGNTTVNTTSMPRPTMEWYFEYAGKVDGKQYYYIVNAFTGDYLYRTGSAIYMKTPSEQTTLEAASDNGFKFYLIPRAAGTYYSGYSIVPYGETAKFLNKSSGNENVAAISAGTNENNHSRWNFVTKTDLINDLAAKLPFAPSSGSSSTYYKIQNGKMDSDNKPYYIIPPASIPGNAEASKSEDAAVVKSGSWYFVKVQDPVLENSDPSQIDWLTYYKIVNAETGKVLYYNFTASASPCINVGDYVENDGNYMFAFVKSPTTDYYYIVPKTAKDNQLANISCFWRDGANMKPATTRATGNNVWMFAAASLFCNAPEFIEEDGKIRIKCNTNSAKIYINTESNADPTIAEENLYAPTTKENQNWATTSQVRIKAIASVSDGTNSASSAVATLLNKPDFTLTEGGNAVADNTYTYDGTAKQPDVTEVSIGEDANKTTATKTTHFTMSYSNNIKAGTPISENPPTVTLVDVPGDDMYVWNASKTFTINKKPVTITADSDTKVYDGTELTKNTYTNTDLADGDAITSVTVVGSQTVVGSSANVPSAAVIKKGEEDRTACYEITYTNGTLEVTKKAVTITADSDTKVYDGTELTKNSYTNTDLADGDAITSVTVTGSQAVVGSSANVPSAAVIKKGEEDRTACYEITYTNGTLEVTKKALTITADSDTKVYDGTALTKNSYTNTALAEGDAIESVTVTGSQTDVGSSANVPSAAVIKKDTEDRTSCYEITYTNGTLTVTGIGNSNSR